MQNTKLIRRRDGRPRPSEINAKLKVIYDL